MVVFRHPQDTQNERKQVCMVVIPCRGLVVFRLRSTLNGLSSISSSSNPLSRIGRLPTLAKSAGKTLISSLTVFPHCWQITPFVFCFAAICCKSVPPAPNLRRPLRATSLFCARCRGVFANVAFFSRFHTIRSPSASIGSATPSRPIRDWHALHRR